MPIELYSFANKTKDMNMAKLADLEEALAEEAGIDASRIRYVARVLQDAGLLPTGKRGGGKNAPTIDERDCAIFLLGLGDPKHTRRLVETEMLTKNGRRNVVDDLAKLIAARCSPARKFADGAGTLTRVIINHGRYPGVEITFHMAGNVLKTTQYRYAPPDSAPMQPQSRPRTLLTAATLLEPEILEIAAKVLCPVKNEAVTP